MAYSGGTYTKPISFGGSDIADLYLKGKMQVVNMRSQVRNQRSKELSEYAEAASQIEATGVNEADKIYQSAANQLRDAAVKAHNDNILGFTNRSFATSKVNNYISQASQVANITKLIGANIEEMDEQIKNLKADDISKDRYNRTWFSEPGGTQSWVKIKDENGKEKTVRAFEIIGTEIIDDKIHFRKTVNHYNKNTNKFEPKTYMAPMSDLTNANPSIIQRFDTNEWVKDLSGTIGNSRAVSVVKGDAVGDAPNYVSSFRLGETDGYTRVITAENLPDIVNTVEVALDAFSTDDEKIISFLSQEFGARAAIDKSYSGMKTEDEINKLFGATKVLGADGKPVLDADGNEKEIPKLYDELGNKIEFTNRDDNGDLIDPLTFQLNEFGIEEITDDQRKLAKAILRDRMLKSFDVKLQDFKERDRLKSATKDTDTNFTTTPATYSYVDSGTQSLIKGATAGTDYLKSKAILSTLAVQGSAGDVGAYNQAKADINKNGRYTLSQDYEMNEELSSFIEFSGKGGVVTKGINIPMNISKKINKKFGLTSTNSKALTDIEQVFFVNDPSGKKGKPQLAFIGKTIIGKKQDTFKTIDGGNKASEVGLKLEEQGQIVTEGIAIASDSDVSRFYRLMYENNPEFKKSVEDSGFIGVNAKNINESDESQIEDALFAYFNNI